MDEREALNVSTDERQEPSTPNLTQEVQRCLLAEPAESRPEEAGSSPSSTLEEVGKTEMCEEVRAVSP